MTATSAGPGTGSGLTDPTGSMPIGSPISQGKKIYIFFAVFIYFAKSLLILHFCKLIPSIVIGKKDELKLKNKK